MDTPAEQPRTALPAQDLAAGEPAVSLPHRQPGASLAGKMATPAATPPPGSHGAVNGHQALAAGSPSASPPAGNPRTGLPAEPVVGATRALRGRPGGPGFHPRRPDARTRRLTAGQSPWQISHRLWAESEIPWELRPAGGPYQPQAPERFPNALPPHAVPPPRTPMGSPPRTPMGSPPRNAPARPTRSGPVPSEPVNGAWPGPMRIPLGAPVFADAQAAAEADVPSNAPANAQPSAQVSAQHERGTGPATGRRRPARPAHRSLVPGRIPGGPPTVRPRYGTDHRNRRCRPATGPSPPTPCCSSPNSRTTGAQAPGSARSADAPRPSPCRSSC